MNAPASNHTIDAPTRRSIRLPSFDYAEAGAYFVTICTHERKCLFGKITDDEMRVNDIGRVVAEEWQRSNTIRVEVETDLFVVMPNHFHGIVFLNAVDVGATGGSPVNVGPLLHRVRPRGPAKRSLGSFVGGFKASVTTRIDAMRGTSGDPVWQRNYYERVIRNEDELQRIRQYILDNPAAWPYDKHNPAAIVRTMRQGDQPVAPTDVNDAS